MEEIVKYINEHPMISWNGIEVALELKRSTLRRGIGTNPKYMPLIIDLLNRYGYGKEVVANYNNDVQEPVAKCTPVDTAALDKALPYIFKCDAQGFYYMDGQLKTRPKGNDTKQYRVIEVS